MSQTEHENEETIHVDSSDAPTEEAQEAPADAPKQSKIKGLLSKIFGGSKKKKLLIWGSLGFLLLALGGAAAWYFLVHVPATEAQAAEGLKAVPMEDPKAANRKRVIDSLAQALQAQNAAENPQGDWVGIAELLVERGLYFHALELRDALKRLASEDADAAWILGRALAGTGRSNEALPFLTRAYEGAAPEEKTERRVWWARAKARTQGVSAIRDSLQLWSQQDAEARALWMEVHIDQNQMPQAWDILQKSSAAHRSATALRMQEARYWMRSGGWEKALNVLESLQEQSPLWGAVYARRGLCKYRLGQWEGARKDFEMALELNPEDYATWSNLARLQQDDWEQNHIQDPTKLLTALKSWLKVLRWQPEDAIAHQKVASILLYNNQPNEAVLHLEKSLTIQKPTVEILLQLASARAQMGDSSNARRALAEATALAPRDPRALELHLTWNTGYNPDAPAAHGTKHGESHGAQQDSHSGEHGTKAQESNHGANQGANPTPHSTSHPDTGHKDSHSGSPSPANKAHDANQSKDSDKHSEIAPESTHPMPAEGSHH